MNQRARREVGSELELPGGIKGVCLPGSLFTGAGRFVGIRAEDSVGTIGGFGPDRVSVTFS